MNQLPGRDVKDFAGAALERVSKRMFGMDEVTRLCLTALYTGGHVLLEGNPGLGKTDLVKTLSETLGFHSGRIQFTPDLMPADITGTYMPDFKNGTPENMVFQPGPVFTCLLLADEINRATPKTQAAMLEAMAEKQVTVLGKRYRLATPFMVLATQNPIDHEGTYTLPEAQADRFMFKVDVPVPDAGSMRRILGKTTGASATPQPQPTASTGDSLLPRNQEAARKWYEALTAHIQEIKPLVLVENHILNIFLATNGRFDELQDLDKNQIRALKSMVSELFAFGLGPRAARDLMRGAKAFSAMFVADAEHAEGPGLARVVQPVLRHRIRLRFDWEELWRKQRKSDPNLSEAELLDDLIIQLALACAPTTHEYRQTFISGLGAGNRE